MDAFFAAVEQRDNPELRGKPIAVGFDGPRGVVSTASYEARRFGVHSAQSIAQAKRLCPDLNIVPCRHEHYKKVSQQIHHIFQDYTDLIEPISIDEAFLDVTHNKKGIELAVDVAREIKARIKAETGLTASAGISYCKFLAKVASDYRKPDGICTIHPDKALDFISQLPVEDFWGVGKKTLQKMHYMGIYRGADLRKVSEQHLVEVFGKAGHVFYHLHVASTIAPSLRIAKGSLWDANRLFRGYIHSLCRHHTTLSHRPGVAYPHRTQRVRRPHPHPENQVCRLHPDNKKHLARQDSEEQGRHTASLQTSAQAGGVFLRPPHPPHRPLSEQCHKRRSQERRP